MLTKNKNLFLVHKQNNKEKSVCVSVGEWKIANAEIPAAIDVHAMSVCLCLFEVWTVNVQRSSNDIIPDHTKSSAVVCKNKSITLDTHNCDDAWNSNDTHPHNIWDSNITWNEKKNLIDLWRWCSGNHQSEANLARAENIPFHVAVTDLNDDYMLIFMQKQKTNFSCYFNYSCDWNKTNLVSGR